MIRHNVGSRLGVFCKLGVVLLLTLFVFTYPLRSHVSAFCFEEAGETYNISPLLLWSIAAVESAFNPNAINRNANGSYDYGVMQINSSWYHTLGKERWSRLSDPCFNVHVGAWVLAQCIQRHGYTWEAVGCYNSSKPHNRRIYANKVGKVLEQVGSQQMTYGKN
ncbi:MAG TPA: lytic transglycosylase domain-containing protein [Syntrophales bacterium]|nr:lytic transglycosylase domain-containing protein [Syntrophales bacterium]